MTDTAPYTPPQPYKQILLKGCYGPKEWKPTVITLAGDTRPANADEDTLTELTINEIYKWYEPRGFNKEGAYEVYIWNIVRHNGETWAIEDRAVKSFLENFLERALFVHDEYDEGPGEDLVGRQIKKFEGEDALNQFNIFWENLKLEDYGNVHTIEPYPCFRSIEMGAELSELSSKLQKVLQNHRDFMSPEIVSLLDDIVLTCNNTGVFLEGDIHRIYTSDK